VPGYEAVDGYADGATTYTYNVVGTLSQDVPVDLFWSPTATFNLFTATLVDGTGYTIPSTTTAGSYTGYVDDRVLTGSPQGTQYLLVVVGDPTSPSFDPTQDTMSALLSLSVAPVSQGNSSWAGQFLDGYDGTKENNMGNTPTYTIRAKGCALTALDMALNNAGLSPSVNPGQLNTELTGTAGFGNDANLDFEEATNIATSQPGQSNSNIVFDTDFTSESTTQDLRDAFTSTAEPIIVHVMNYTNHPNGGNHYVLVTGLTPTSFTINDPGFSARTTLNYLYNNGTGASNSSPPPTYLAGAYHDYQDDGFTIVGCVQDPPAGESKLDVSLESTNPNLSLAVVDSEGRVTGKTPATSVPLGQIPGSSYLVEGPLEDLSGVQNDGIATDRFVYISQPAAGYELEISGAGAYTVTITGVTADGQLTLPFVFSGTSSSATPSFAPIQFTGGTLNEFAPGATAAGGNLYLVGDTAGNDQIQISPFGTSNTGSTGVQINGTLNGVKISSTYALESPSIFFNGSSGNDSVQLASTLTLNADIFAGGGNDNVVAGGGSTMVVLGDGADTIQLTGGNENVLLGNGNDNVQLGSGNSTVTLGNGNDNVRTGAGNMTVQTGNCNDIVQLGSGDDTVTLGNGNDVVNVIGNGNNTITLGNGSDCIVTGNGTDVITLGTGSHQVFGGNGNKIITAPDAAGTRSYFQFGNGNDVFLLGQGNDQVVLGSGNNTVTAGNGNDAVTATGSGNNTVTLGNGSDYINTGNATDVISLGSGNENIQVGNGQKTIVAGGGNDYVSAGNGSVSVTLLGGNDRVQLGAGNDNVSLGNGNDYVAAGDGNDNVTVGNGNDNVQLGNGSDVIVEGNGNDYASAGNGSDLVVGGLGQHTIQLGNGNDILIDGSATAVNPGDSLRKILNDWNASPTTLVNQRLKVVYNSSYPNSLKAGSGRDWFFYTYPKTTSNKKATDRLN